MKSKMFIPKDITLKDDSRHKKFCLLESWYFETILENNYSIVAQINVLNIGRFGTVIVGLQIYKNTELIKRIRKKHKYCNFFSSEKEVSVKIDNVEILKGHIKNNKWQYDINIQKEQTYFKAKFTNTVKGWKTKTFAGEWLVIPRLNVSGKLFLDGKEIEIKGRGYHDHNLFPIYTPLRTKGWHYGTVSVNSNVLTWVRVIKNRKSEKIIVVYNYENGYIKIPSEDIEFKIEAEKKDNKKIIPKIFNIKINNENIVANLRLEALNTHYIHMPTFNYWRYHLKASGNIKTNNTTKKINSIEISEYMQIF